MATDSKFYPVPVYKQNHGFVRVEDGATAGATIGQDLLFFNDGVAGARELGISTGLLEGGKITINADPTKIDIAAGRALFVDFTQHEPVVVTKAFGPYIGVPINDIAIQPVTYISIDKDLNVIQTSAELTNAQRRSMVELGIAVHTNRTTVNVINTLAQTIESTAAQLHDFMEAIGPFNKSGNVYSAVGGNLQLRKTAGDIFKFGVAYDSTPYDPHTIDQPSVNPITFRYRKRDSVEYADTTNVDPNNYDLGGVLTAVQANRYTVQRIYMFQSGLTRIQYGQAEYQTLNEAVGNFEKEVFETELNMRTNGIIRGFLVVKQGATDLADPAQAQFFEASKFGLATGAGGGGVDFATIVAALGYTPANQARDLIAGDGLTGGGDLSATRTVAMGTPSTVTTSTTNSTTADSHTHALTIADGSLTIAKVNGLQTELNNRAVIGGTPQFTDVRIGADNDILLYEGAVNQFNIRVGPAAAYKYFGFNTDGSFTAPFNIVAGNDVYARDLRTDRGDGTGAIWFGGDAAGYMYRSGATSFEFRAGANFYYLTSPGTIFTTGNFDPATKLNVSNPTATGDLTVGGRIISNGAHFNSSTTAAVLSAAGGTIYLRPNGADSGSNEATLTTAGNFTAPGYVFAGGDIRGAALYPTNNNGAYMSGNGGGIQHNGNWYHNGPFFRLSADSASWVAQPRTFVQSTDPGAQAADGDIWIW